jgi:cobalt-precorrin-5B (C1)-methyltransferase
MTRDPVTGFEYPEEWIAACASPHLLPLVERGCAVLTSSGTILRRGITTGSTAAAAAKAAVLSLTGSRFSRVAITTPCGITIRVPVTISCSGRAICRKYAGDYPDDATAGVEIIATATPIPSGVEVVAGEGVGRWTRDTPRSSAGDPAISHTAMEYIRRSIEEVAGAGGIRVEICIPRGKEIAPSTLNPRIGIEGGISILGTTGLVEPWDDHLVEAVIDRIGRSRRVVLTTGRTGLRFARLLFPEHESVLVGSRIGQALDAAQGDVILCGLPGLILRFIDPDILDGTGCATVEELSSSPGWNRLKGRAIAAYKARYPNVRVVLLARDGCITGDSG